MKDADIKTLAEQILRSKLSGYSFQGVEVHTGLDNSDEPAVYVEALLGEGAPSFEGTTFSDAYVALSQELLAHGENRFPYLRTRRLGDDLPSDAV